ncbi:aldo/keto reductase [Myxococcota bacterium]|nr:aldo/keto reductase [Myxococcota bacterium]
MELRTLGRSGLKVSPLCLGAMTFGEADSSSFMHKVGCDEATSHAIMSRALDAGVQFWDTADVYGQDGLSERVVGSWFQATGQRDRVVLATKFRFAMPYGKGAGRRHIVRACEESLRRLRTDWIDLYQVHMQDLDVPEEETLRALDDLVRQGKVRYLGASNYAAYRLVDSLWTSRAQGLERWIALQMQYSLVERGLEREHVPTAVQWGLGVIPWSPLAGGFLTGKYRPGQGPPAGSRLSEWKDRWSRMDDPRNWRILDAVDQVAAQTGASAAQVSLAWLLHKPGVSSVIFGARTVAQLEDNLPAAALALSTEQVALLDQASATPLPYPYDFMHRVQGRW